MSDHYDYAIELSDYTDKLQFGKYKHVTPNDLVQLDPGYMIWAWRNTNMWVGSDEVVKKAFEAEGKLDQWKPRAVSEPVAQLDLNDQAEACHQAIFEAYGHFPKPLWMK